MAAITIGSGFGLQENILCHCFHIFPISYEVMGLDAVIFVFWMLSFNPAFSLFSFYMLYSAWHSFCRSHKVHGQGNLGPNECMPSVGILLLSFQ